jgi:hypothetical protein
MKKKIFLLIIGIILALSFIFPANATEQQYKDDIGFEYVYTEAYDLQNTNGDERLYLKKLADLERSSKSAIHYDNQIKSDYMCDWQYDKVLDRWVCGKDYMKAYSFTHPTPIQACPFGYELNYGRTGCVKIPVPANAHYNSRGNGWECNPGFHVSYTGTSCLSDKYVYTSCTGTTCTGCTTTTTKSTFQNSSDDHYINQPQSITVFPITYADNTPYPVKYVNPDGYLYDNVETPTVLAKTGPSTLWLLVFGFLGFIILGMSQVFIK